MSTSTAIWCGILFFVVGGFNANGGHIVQHDLMEKYRLEMPLNVNAGFGGHITGERKRSSLEIVPKVKVRSPGSFITPRRHVVYNQGTVYNAGPSCRTRGYLQTKPVCSTHRHPQRKPECSMDPGARVPECALRHGCSQLFPSRILLSFDSRRVTRWCRCRLLTAIILSSSVTYLAISGNSENLATFWSVHNGQRARAEITWQDKARSVVRGVVTGLRCSRNSRLCLNHCPIGLIQTRYYEECQLPALSPANCYGLSGILRSRFTQWSLFAIGKFTAHAHWPGLDTCRVCCVPRIAAVLRNSKHTRSFTCQRSSLN
ncbi:hypothetical protein J6590_071195 [Homalodisca vitripennis]|nr:hypothetical protein J6590_071195 [Homalodisca vitripennis]